MRKLILARKSLLSRRFQHAGGGGLKAVPDLTKNDNSKAL
jgi:hypothetical protein